MPKSACSCRQATCGQLTWCGAPALQIGSWLPTFFRHLHPRHKEPHRSPYRIMWLLRRALHRLRLLLLTLRGGRNPGHSRQALIRRLVKLVMILRRGRPSVPLKLAQRRRRGSIRRLPRQRQGRGGARSRLPIRMKTSLAIVSRWRYRLRGGVSGWPPLWPDWPCWSRGVAGF